MKRAVLKMEATVYDDMTFRIMMHQDEAVPFNVSLRATAVIIKDLARQINEREKCPFYTKAKK